MRVQTLNRRQFWYVFPTVTRIEVDLVLARHDLPNHVSLDWVLQVHLISPDRPPHVTTMPDPDSFRARHGNLTKRSSQEAGPGCSLRRRRAGDVGPSLANYLKFSALLGCLVQAFPKAPVSFVVYIHRPKIMIW